MGLRVLVCGGRNFNDAVTLRRHLGWVFINRGIDLIIHGGASGADYMAGKFAERLKIRCKEYPADWKNHGKAAGPIRNANMLADSTPDLVVAFAGGAGTADMVAKARAAGVEVLMATAIQ